MSVNVLFISNTLWSTSFPHSRPCCSSVPEKIHFPIHYALPLRCPIRAAQWSADDEQSTTGLNRTSSSRSLLRIQAQRPIWTYIVIAINVSILLVQRLFEMIAHLWPNVLLPDILRAWAKMSVAIIGHGQMYRLVTAALLHVNVRHAIFNCYAIYALGSAAEILYGAWGFMAIYLMGAVYGNVLSVLIRPTSLRLSVGSSGAIFGLIAAMCVHLEHNREAIGGMARGNLRMVGTAMILNLLGGWVMPLVDGWAHLGGVLAGLVVGGWLVPRMIVHRGARGHVTYVEVRRKGRWESIIVCILGVGLAIGMCWLMGKWISR